MLLDLTRLDVVPTAVSQARGRNCPFSGSRRPRCLEGPLWRPLEAEPLICSYAQVLKSLCNKSRGAAPTPATFQGAAGAVLAAAALQRAGAAATPAAVPQ